MTPDLLAVLRAGLALWRRDRSILAPLSGLFVFLPQWAVLLLVPELPRMAGEADRAAALDAWSQALSGWFAAHGLLYVGAMALGQLGSRAGAALDLSQPGVTAGGALGRALRLLPRFVLASLLVALPLGLIALMLVPLPAGLVFAIPPIFYVLGRTCLAGPVIVAERGAGALAAVGRSWALTRGRGVAVALLVGGITVSGQTAGSVVVAIDHTLKTANIANPVVLAIVDAGAAAAAWAAALALALVQVVLYRRLSR
jgi:hypothetical protein